MQYGCGCNKSIVLCTYIYTVITYEYSRINSVYVWESETMLIDHKWMSKCMVIYGGLINLLIMPAIMWHWKYKSIMRMLMMEQHLFRHLFARSLHTAFYRNWFVDINVRELICFYRCCCTNSFFLAILMYNIMYVFFKLKLEWLSRQL